MSVIEQVIFVGILHPVKFAYWPCQPKDGKLAEQPFHLIRVRDHRDPEGRLRNILVDCGKTFYQSAIDIFPRYGIREIDGLILTHGHADAVLGLDDLRSWTSAGSVQETVPIYLSDESFAVVSRAFPYLVSKAHATGGGEVASFNFNVVKRDETFEIAGLDIVPLPVHHGVFMSTGEPYWCFGYQFGNQLSCVMDANFVPSETFDRMRNSDILIVDCLREEPYLSHFGYYQALDVIKEVKAKHNYFIGMAHNLEHDDLKERATIFGKEQGLYVSPAYDTLKVELLPNGHIKESSWRE
ncbi:unnamed protein product [Umbelopsis vinacea]